MGQRVVVTADHQHIHDALVADQCPDGLECGVGNAVLAQQLQDKLHHRRIVGIEARRSAVLTDGCDDLVGYASLPGRRLVDRPDVVPAGFTCNR